MRERRGYHALTLSRRDVLRAASAYSAYALMGCSRRGALATRPVLTPWGVQSGDVTSSSAVVWCRADRPARMSVEWSTSPAFENNVMRITGANVGPEGDLVGKVTLRDLPSGTRIHYRARFSDLSTTTPEAPWVVGSFGTAPAKDQPGPVRDVLIAWSGDTNGQGWGIDPSRGGMPAYTALLARNPDLFIHCGDAIYADNPIPESVPLPDGGVWKNITDPIKDHVAETLEDFRGAHLYPRRSPEVRALSAACPLFHIWDDHEVRNNWFPSEVIDDGRYKERRMDALAIHARRAMYEHTPTLRDPSVIYRVVNWGPLVDIFFLDGRTYRSANEPAPAEAVFLGNVQSAWLVDALSRSTAVWKIIACDMPIGVAVSDPGRTTAWAHDGWANENGPPLERERELSRLLSALRERKVKNIVWVTADVHYAAAHRFDPARAVFKDFDPFWELIAGPLHATAFPQKALDDTFGPELAWASSERTTPFGPPSDAGTQSFGLLRVDGKTRELVVTFVDGRGRDLHRLSLTPTK